jgi:hypothetical protein
MQQAAPAAEAPAEELSEEKAVMAEAERVIEAEAVVETVIKEAEKVAEPAAPPPAPEKATDEVGLSREDMPAEAAQAESEVVVAEEGEALMDTSSDRAATGIALSPTASPAPAAEAMPAAPAPTPTLQATLTLTPTLLEVENLDLVIEPGVIRASGRLPLPEGRKILVVLWRDGQLVEWATLESQCLVIEADGQFFLEFQAQAEILDSDLFDVEPAYYELRIRPIEPPGPVEARIPFDTYSPPPPAPTDSP